MEIKEDQELRKRINVPQKEEVVVDELKPLIQEEDDKNVKEAKAKAAKVIKYL